MPGAASIITWRQDAHARQARRCIGSWTSSLAIVSGMDLGRSGRARWRAAHKMPRLAPNTSLIGAVSSRGSCLKREQTQEPGPRSVRHARMPKHTNPPPSPRRCRRTHGFTIDSQLSCAPTPPGVLSAACSQRAWRGVWTSSGAIARGLYSESLMRRVTGSRLGLVVQPGDETTSLQWELRVDFSHPR